MGVVLHRMKVKVFIVCLIFMLTIFLTCSSHEPMSFEDSEFLQVHVNKVEYVLENIHASYFGESIDKYYKTISLNVFIDGAIYVESLKRILIIDDENRLGWEFRYTDIIDSYDKDKGVFHLQHLIIDQSFIIDKLFTIHLYGEGNKTTKFDHQFIVKARFPHSVNVSNQWYDHNNLNVNVFGNITFLSEGSLYWMNNNQVIDTVDFMIHESREFFFTDVPVLATKFYIKIEGLDHDTYKRIITSQGAIEDRMPDDVDLFDENVKIDQAIYDPSNETITLLNKEKPEILLTTFDQRDIKNVVELPSNPEIAKVFQEGVIFIGLSDGNLFQLNTNTVGLEFLFKYPEIVHEFVILDTIMIASVGYNHCWTIDLRSGGGYVYSDIFNRYPVDMVANQSNSVVYYVSSSGLFRFEVDMSTGQIENHNDAYYHSNYKVLAPLFISPNESVLITGGGTMFQCSADYSDDLRFIHHLGNEFTDIAMSPDPQNVIIIQDESESVNSSDIDRGNLKVIDAQSHEEKVDFDLYGKPQHLFLRGNEILIIARLEKVDRYYALHLDYNELISTTTLNKSYISPNKVIK